MFKIESKENFQDTSLTVKIPEKELDQKAFYTLSADLPEFLLPFRHRAIDGQIEFTFQVGTLGKLEYYSAKRPPKEYAELWVRVLQPLLDCNDWFLTPYSFVLEYQYLFYDRNSKTVKFLYIPSSQPYSNDKILQQMVMNIARNNPVTDVSLENKVVWAIQDFHPKQFLQMIMPYQAQQVASQTVTDTSQKGKDRIKPTPIQQEEDNKKKLTDWEPMLQEESKKKKKQEAEAEPVEPEFPQGFTGGRNDSGRDPGDIEIHFPKEEEKPKEKKKKSGISLFGKGKKEKDAPKTGGKGFPFGKKKEQPQEIIGGSGTIEDLYDPIDIPYRGTPDAGGGVTQIQEEEPFEDVTQLVEEESQCARFQYIGHKAHPPVIAINIAEGDKFTIGRYDVSVGYKQSDFEFEKETKGVTRNHHAAVIRKNGAYLIMDLNSSAGTFLNGQKITPNVPFPLAQGCRVSFGNLGADYVWEEN